MSYGFTLQHLGLTEAQALTLYRQTAHVMIWLLRQQQAVVTRPEAAPKWPAQAGYNSYSFQDCGLSCGGMTLDTCSEHHSSSTPIVVR